MFFPFLQNSIVDHTRRRKENWGPPPGLFIPPNGCRVGADLNNLKATHTIGPVQPGPRRGETIHFPLHPLWGGDSIPQGLPVRGESAPN